MRNPFFTRSGRPAPRCWLTNVVSAMLKQVTGRNAKPSMRECAPQPAMAAAPNALIFVCTTTLANEMMHLEMPEGMPEGGQMPEGMPSGDKAAAGDSSRSGEKSTASVQQSGAPEGFVAVQVTTGIVNDDYVEILSGLVEGDVVYIDPSAGTTTNMFQMGMPGGGMGGGMPGGGNMGGGGMPSGGGNMGGGMGGRP